MAELSFPHVEQKIEDFLYDEEGNIPVGKVLTIGSMILILGLLMADDAFAAHRSHSSHSSHSSHQSGYSGGHSSHTSHASHQSSYYDAAPAAPSSGGSSAASAASHASHSNVARSAVAIPSIWTRQSTPCSRLPMCRLRHPCMRLTRRNRDAGRERT